MSPATEQPDLRALVRARIDRWRGGERPNAAALLAEHPALGQSKSLVLDLALEEYCLRREAGDDVAAEDFCRRFAGHEEAIARLIEACELLDRCPEFAVPPPHRDWPVLGQSFLGFDILEPLGHGALARVYLASDPELGGRLYALKVSPYGRHEATILGKVEHENVVPVASVEHDPAGDWTAIRMPFLGTATVEHLIARVRQTNGAGLTGDIVLQVARAYVPWDYRLPETPASELAPWRGAYWEAVAHIGCQLARGLAAAHDRGIMHRDLKPSNVLLAWSGRPMLLDFNLATDRFAASRQFGGTPAYMAPEVLASLIEDGGLRAREFQAAADIYSLGAVLFELLTGKLPFGPPPGSSPLPDSRAAEDFAGWLACKRQPPPAVPWGSGRGERGLRAILARCLALEPGQRFGSAHELAAALAALLQQSAARQARGVQRRRLLTALGATAVCGAAGALYVRSLPPYHEARLAEGLALYGQGEYGAAVEAFSDCLAKQAAWPEALFARGQALRQQAKWLEAVNDFLALEPAHAGWSSALAGWCYDDAGRHREACTHFAAARLRGIRERSTLLRFGYAALKAERAAEAAMVFGELVAYDADDWWARLGRAETYRLRANQAQGRTAGQANSGTGRAGTPRQLDRQALADVEHACRVNPGSAFCHHLAALLYHAAAREDAAYRADAIRHLERAIALGYPAESARRTFPAYQTALADHLLVAEQRAELATLRFPQPGDLSLPATACWAVFLAEVGRRKYPEAGATALAHG